MSGQDQATGLRKWAALQRQQRGADEVGHNVESDETVPAAPVNEEEAAAYTQEAVAPTVAAAAEPSKTEKNVSSSRLTSCWRSAGGQSARSAGAMVGPWEAMGRRPTGLGCSYCHA